MSVLRLVAAWIWRGVVVVAGEEVAGAGAHPVGNVSQGEALLAADCFEVTFYRIHIGHISWKQRYGFADRLTNLFCCLLVEYQNKATSLKSRGFYIPL